MHLVTYIALQQFTAATTVESLPDGYKRAIEFNLATEIASEYDVSPSPFVVQKANASLSNIKRLNQRMPSMLQETVGLSAQAGGRYRIFGDSYR